MTTNETSTKVEEALFGVDAVAQSLIERLMRHDAQQVDGAEHNVSLVNLLQNEVKRALKLLDGADDDEATSTPPPTRAEADAPETAAPTRSHRATTLIDRARDGAQTTVYEIRHLVRAAMAVNESEEVGAVLEAASAKLTALSVALDSVNWPRGQHAQ